MSEYTFDQDYCLEMLKRLLSIDSTTGQYEKIQLATARRKINGDIGITFKDCEKVAKLFNEHNTVDYLFKS